MLEMVLIFPLLIVFAVLLGIGLAYLIYSILNDDDDDTPSTGATGGWVLVNPVNDLAGAR